MAFSPGSQSAAVAPVRTAAAGRMPQRNAAERAADGTANPAPPPRSPGPGSRPDAIRTHASIAPGDALHSPYDRDELGRRIAGRAAANHLPEEDRAGTLVLARRKSVPYDPHPVRRPILDILA